MSKCVALAAHNRHLCPHDHHGLLQLPHDAANDHCRTQPPPHEVDSLSHGVISDLPALTQYAGAAAARRLGSGMDV
eukprot:5804539-Amphidinium_carterae.1